MRVANLSRFRVDFTEKVTFQQGPEAGEGVSVAARAGRIPSRTCCDSTLTMSSVHYTDLSFKEWRVPIS